MSDKPLVITRLEVENLLRLKAVRITPEPGQPVVFIRGRNAQGKSSVLDAIAMGLGGKAVQPPKPVHDGAEAARGLIELGGEFVVERRISADGKSALAITAKDGAKYPSPQRMLDSMVGQLSFDPMAFIKLGAKEQAEAVRKLSGLDFDELYKRREQAFEARTAVNASGKSLKARYDAMPPHSGAEKVDVDALVESLNKADAEQAEVEELRRRADALGNDCVLIESQIQAQQRRIAQLEQEIASARSQIVSLNKAAEIARLDAEDVRDRLETKTNKDVRQELRQKLATAAQANAKWAADQLRLKTASELDGLRQQSINLSTEIEDVDKCKARMLKDAKLPVEGLAFTSDGVTLNGIPFEQASGAEKLRVSVAMGIALNPKIGVLLIRDGSLLDDQNLEAVSRQVADAGCQLWLEVVGKGDVGVVIEDGEVEMVDGEPPAGTVEKEKKKAKARRAES